MLLSSQQIQFPYIIQNQEHIKIIIKGIPYPIPMKIRSKTQFIEDEEHLCVDIINEFPQLTKEKAANMEMPHDDADLVTNFGITVNNPYCFVLLHLRNKSSKNPINVNIPEVCIFHDRIPYDIIYASKGYIRGHKTNDSARLRLKQMNKVFKQVWTQNNLPKNQPSVASFAQQQMLMLSDNDLYLVSCKTKIDPFFKHLRYIRNKIPANNSIPIISHFYNKEQEETNIKLATTSLMGFHNEQEIEKLLLTQGEERYLKYLNQKIHNIRIIHCDFIYTKTNDGKYYLVNIKNLQFTNLTAAILDREKRLAQREEERNKILIMTPEKEIKYRQFQNKQFVKVYEELMSNQFNSILSKMNLHSISDNKKQQVRNQLAFKKLHPRSKYTYTQVITSSNFMKVKDQALQKPLRKPITEPSRYVMRYYNKIRNPRVKTQIINPTYF